MFGNLLAVICLFSLNMIVLVLAGLLHLLPAFFKAVRRGIRFILMLSSQFYDLILTQAAPGIDRHLGVDILKGFARIATSILLSLVIGVLLFRLLNISLNGLTMGICILHGLIVGLAWDGNSNFEALNLGDTIE